MTIPSPEELSAMFKQLSGDCATSWQSRCWSTSAPVPVEFAKASIAEAFLMGVQTAMLVVLQAKESSPTGGLSEEGPSGGAKKAVH